MIYFLSLILALLPSYLIRFKLFGLPTTILEIMIVVFLLLTLLRFKFNDFNKIKTLGRINYAIAAFVLAGAISTLIAPDQMRGLGQLKAFIIEPVLMFYAIILTVNKDQLKILLKFLLGGTVLISLFGILQHFSYILLPLRFWGTGIEVLRITSIFEYPNALALYLAPLVGFYFTLWIKDYELFTKKYWLPIYLSIMILALVMTFSRGGLFAVIFILALLAIRSFGFKYTVPAFLIIAALLGAVPPLRHRVALGFSDASSSTHLQLLKVGVNETLNHPLLGIGLGNFNSFGVSYPHNIFLNFWLELGFLGLISFCFILLLSFQKEKTPTALSLAAGVFLMIMVIHGLVDVPYFKNDLAVMFWFIISIFYL